MIIPVHSDRWNPEKRGEGAEISAPFVHFAGGLKIHNSHKEWCLGCETKSRCSGRHNEVYIIFVLLSL